MSFTLTTSTQASTKQVDLSSLPVTVVNKQPRGTGIFLVLFSLFWGGLPTMGLITSAYSGSFKPEMIFMLLFTVIGAAMFLGGIHMLIGSTTTIIDRNRVTVIKKSLFGTRQWTESLPAFMGITWRSEYHSGGKNRPSYTLYIVELKHSDAKKMVKLYESKSGADIRAIWENYCRQLNMPAVETDGNSVIKRDVADLDKSVRQLIEEGKVKVNMAPTSPPRDLAVKADGDVLELTVVKKKLAPLGFIIMLIVPLAFIYAGFFMKDCSVIFGLIGVVILVIFIAGAVYSYMSSNQIRIGRDEIHIRQRLPWGISDGEKIKTELIEVVRIGRKSGQGGDAVLLETDHGDFKVGEGLSRDALEWIKNCILRQIALQSNIQSHGLLDKSNASFNSSNFVSKIAPPPEQRL